MRKGKSRRLFHLGGALVCCVLATGLVSACAEDTILEVDHVCGNGEVEVSETCDNDSEGCVDCQIAAGWECPDNACHSVCGDGIQVGDEECDSEDRTQCDSACQSGTRTTGCDMTGYWITRQTDFSIDRVLNGLQTSTNWYVYKISQSGSTFTIDENIFCGIRVSGSVDVVLPEIGVKALMYRNSQDQTNTVQGPRQGEAVAAGDSCTFSLERWYFLRGLDFDADPPFAPADFSTNAELGTLRAMPTPDTPDGAVDTDGDGHLGMRWEVTGNASGVRHTVMRDWNEYSPDPEFPIGPNQIEFTSYSKFDNQEVIFETEGCPPIGCGVLEALSDPSKTHKGRVTFRYLGANLDDPRVAAIVGSPLHMDEAEDLATCARVRDALPHKDSKDLGVKK
ncbi:MAG: DUF4215 domain-containing protein [Polyangiaceae bacterium]